MEIEIVELFIEDKGQQLSTNKGFYIHLEIRTGIYTRWTFVFFKNSSLDAGVYISGLTPSEITFKNFLDGRQNFQSLMESCLYKYNLPLFFFFPFSGFFLLVVYFGLLGLLLSPVVPVSVVTYMQASNMPTIIISRVGLGTLAL